jgi:hypothetical protein
VTNENLYWPFPMPYPDQQSPQQAQAVAFLERAHAEGFAPYSFGVENFGATTGTRAGELFCRSHLGTHWEVCLVREGQFALSAHLSDFSVATEALLSWLRGATTSEILERVRPSLRPTRSSPLGYTIA